MAKIDILVMHLLFEAKVCVSYIITFRTNIYRVLTFSFSLEKPEVSRVARIGTVQSHTI